MAFCTLIFFLESFIHINRTVRFTMLSFCLLVMHHSVILRFIISSIIQLRKELYHSLKCWLNSYFFSSTLKRSGIQKRERSFFTLPIPYRIQIQVLPYKLVCSGDKSERGRLRTVVLLIKLACFVIKYG